MQPNRDTVIKTMRSLLNTNKNGMLERELRRDFRDMEGYDIPYKAFGYSTLLDFIRESGQFELYSTNDGMNIRARVIKSSAHIVNLVESQNRDRRKKANKPMPLPRFPQCNSNANRNYQKQAPAYGRPTTQQSHTQRPQAGYAFANAANRNNWHNNNNYKPTHSVPSSTVNQTNLINWDEVHPAILQSVQQNIQQRPMYSNNAHKNGSGAAKCNATPAPTVPTPCVSVNTRLQANGNTETRKPIVNNVPAAAKQSLEKVPVQEEPKWDENPPRAINLTQSSKDVTEKSTIHQQRQTNGQIANGKSSSTDAKWKNDMYDPKQPIRKSTVQPISQRLIPTQVIKQQAKIIADQKEKPSPWLTLGPIIREPMKDSASDGSDPKEPKNDQQQQRQLNQNSAAIVSKSIQSRLAVQVEKQADTVDFITPKRQQQQQEQSKLIQPELKEPSKTTGDEIETESTANKSKRLLQKRCEENSYDPPEYKCNFSNKFKKFTGTVCVEGVTFSTAPLDYADETKAENAAADVALENIKTFPTASGSCQRIAQNIYDCIGLHGIVLKHLPNIYEQKYGESLPNDWKKILEDRPELFSITLEATNLLIVYKNSMPAQLATTIDNRVDVLPVMTTVTIKNDTMPNASMRTNRFNGAKTAMKIYSTSELPPLKLPWNERIWHILITSASSTVDVWGHIYDSNDAKKLDKTLRCIGDTFMSDYTRPEPCCDHEIVVDHLYLAVHKAPNADNLNEFVYHPYRVCIQSIDRTTEQALCYYIDEGVTELLDCKTTLFHLNAELMEYPALAIQFCLFDLEDFASNEYACEVVRQQLEEQSLFAAIKTTQTESEQQSDNRIRAIFFDTSMPDVDRNINNHIIEMIVKRVPVPQLNSREATVVNVTHVCDNGDVFCRLHGTKEMHTIDQILNRINITDDHRVDAKQLMSNGGRYLVHRLFLAHNKKTRRNYRVQIIPNESETLANCRFVDYGYSKNIPFDDIYHLESLSYLLFLYPNQAIFVQLNCIDSNDYTADSIQRMREMLGLRTQEPISLNVAVRSEWPIVDVWKNIDGVDRYLNKAIQKELQVNGQSNSTGINSNQLRQQLECHPKLTAGQVYDATVITAFSPTLFYVRLNTNDEVYNRLTNWLWRSYEGSDEVMSKDQIQLNHLYACRLRDCSWHRVKVQAFSSYDTVSIEKWDCGDMENVRIDELRRLDNPSIHQLVFCARLHDLQSRRSSWNKDDCARFIALTVGKKFKVEILNNDNSIAEVILIGPNNVNISEVLVQEGRAI